MKRGQKRSIFSLKDTQHDLILKARWLTSGLSVLTQLAVSQNAALKNSAEQLLLLTKAYPEVTPAEQRAVQTPE